MKKVLMVVVSCAAAAIIFGVTLTVAAIMQNRHAEIATLNHEIKSLKAELEQANKNADGSLDVMVYPPPVQQNLALTDKKTKTVTPTGYLDAANCNVVGGWANGPVDIYDGNKLIAKLPANLNRSDVGKHAFSISTWALMRLMDGRYHYVNVRHAGTALLLSNGGRMIQCGNAPEHTRRARLECARCRRAV